MLRFAVLWARLDSLRFCILSALLCVRVRHTRQPAVGNFALGIWKFSRTNCHQVLRSPSLTGISPCRSNMKRVFRSSLWLQALLFFVLFCGAHWSLNIAMSVTSDHCQADLPATVIPPHIKPAPARFDARANAHETWLTGRKLLQVDDAPGKFTEAFADVLPSAAVAHAVVHGGYAPFMSCGFSEPDLRPCVFRLLKIES